MRLAWHEVWSDVAVSVAKRSRCVRQQNGAVIVSAENKLLATGYNGPPARWRPELDGTCDEWCDRCINGPSEVTMKSYEDCPSLHAEMNALMYSDASARRDGTMFVTSHPCFNCAKAIANSGLAFVVIVDAEGRGYREPEASYVLLEDSGVKVLR